MSRIIYSCLFVFAASVSGNFASASSSWLHSRITGTNGVLITVDFQVISVVADDQNLLYARPMWINISGANMTSTSKVRAVVGNSCSSVYQQQIADLTPTAENRFTLPVEGSLINKMVAGIQKPCLLRLAVVVDGTWITGQGGMFINLANAQSN